MGSPRVAPTPIPSGTCLRPARARRARARTRAHAAHARARPRTPRTPAHARARRARARTPAHVRARGTTPAHVRARARTPRARPRTPAHARARPRTSAHVRARRTTRHCPGSLTLRFPHTQIPSRSDSVQGGAEVCHRPGWSEILRGRAWASARGRRQVPEGMGVGATLGLPVALSAQ